MNRLLKSAPPRRPWRLTPIVIVGFLFALIPSRVTAQEARTLERGRELFRSFEYDEALELMQHVVDDGSSSAAERIGALELVGVIHLLQRRQDEARQSFERLLALDPGHELDDSDLPPRVREFFDEVRTEAPAAAQPETELDAPDTFPEAGVAPVLLTLSGETAGVARALLHLRSSQNSDFFVEEPMTRQGDSFSSDVEAPSEGNVDFFITLEAPSGHVLASVGSEDEPRTITVPAPIANPEPIAEAEGRPWYRTWWFWTVVGVVVAGGVTAGVIAGTRPEEHQDGTLGTVQMPIVTPEL